VLFAIPNVGHTDEYVIASRPGEQIQEIENSNSNLCVKIDFCEIKLLSCLDKAGNDTENILSCVQNKHGCDVIQNIAKTPPPRAYTGQVGNGDAGSSVIDNFKTTKPPRAYDTDDNK